MLQPGSRSKIARRKNVKSTYRQSLAEKNMLQPGSRTNYARRKNVNLVYLNRPICLGLGKRSVGSGEKK